MLKHLFVICLLTSACAAVEERRALDSWIGKPVDSLVRAVGIPARSYRLSDGSVAIEYNDGYEDTVLVPTPVRQSASPYQTEGTLTTHPDFLGGTTGEYHSTTSPGLTFNESTGLARRRVWRECWTTFATDAKRIIVGWSRRGEGC